MKKMPGNKFVVYLLRSEKDGRFYTGHTNDSDRRTAEHDRGKVKSTRNRRPLTLVYEEYYDSKRKAYARERYLKSLEGGWHKKLLASE
jgi:putative endonuclease